MSNDTRNGRNNPEDQPLSPEEEAVLSDLFAESDRWTLEGNWVEQLFEEIESNTETTTDEAPLVEFDGASAPIDLTKEREVRRRDYSSLQRLMVASFVLAVVIGGASLLLQDSTQTAEVEEIPVLDASREVDAPNVVSLEVPEGTTSFIEVGQGETVALAQPDGSDLTALAVSTDLTTWESRSTLPVVDAVGDFSTDTWYVAGGDAESIVQVGVGDSSRIATDLAVFSSTDRGATWESIEIDVAPIVYDRDGLNRADRLFEIPFTVPQPQQVTVAVVDDTLLVGYTAVPITDWTTLAREFDLVDDQTEVVQIGGGFDRYWAVGPTTFEELDIDAVDIGMERVIFDDLRLWEDPVVQRSTGGSPFQQVELPRMDVLNDLIFAPVVTAVDGQFAVFNNVPFGWGSEAVLISADGLEWTQVDNDLLDEIVVDALGGLFVNRDDWKLRIVLDDNGVIAEQRVDGTSPYTPVPTPDVQAQAELGFGTDFGAAIVWQDTEANSLASIRSTVESNGYQFEIFDNLTMAVTSPDGTVVSEGQSLRGVPQDRIVLDPFGTIRLYDADGTVLASIEMDQIAEAYLTTGIRAENPPARFISWATTNDDWRFAELEGLAAVLWNFQETERGLLATAIDDPSEALLIEWPTEYEELTE